MYGGLITSRESNATTAEVETRARRITMLKGAYPQLKGVFASSVIMRIPAYNGNFEEPWYWEEWGYDLYEYSYHLSRFEHKGEPEDEASAVALAKIIPDNVLEEFLWRRQRNHNVSVMLLDVLGHDQRRKPHDE